MSAGAAPQMLSESFVDVGLPVQHVEEKLIAPMIIVSTMKNAIFLTFTIFAFGGFFNPP